MIELGQHLSLLTQSSAALFSRKTTQQLERYSLLKRAVGALGQKHRTHAARTDLAQHAPRPQTFTLMRGHDAARCTARDAGIEQCIRYAIGGKQLDQLFALVCADGQRCQRRGAFPLRDLQQSPEVLDLRIQRWPQLIAVHASNARLSQARP